MKENSSTLNKLLSHRLRGFSQIEHTLTALQKACNCQIPYLEIDTRTSSDREIYVYHDVIFCNGNTSYNLSKSSSHILNALKYRTGEKLLSLKKALSVFKKRKYSDQKLCIDIKDYGFEKEHLQLVRDYHLEENVIFVSWIPQTLFKLSELGTTCPLILSHWNVMRFGWFGKKFYNLFANQLFSIGYCVLIGINKSIVPLSSLERGYQHTVIAQ